MVVNKLRGILSPQSTKTRPASKRLVAEFAESVGLVYFGYVSQRDDEHHILRGMTVSNRHRDDHYCIGTVDGYDTVFVERSDTLKNGKKHLWHIMEFDLKTRSDLPHIFIGSLKKGHGFHELLETKYPTLLAANLGATQQYAATFTDKFAVYVAPSHVHTFEQLIPADIAATIASHFEGLVVEITDQALYVYSEASHASLQLLQTMARNGAWLANVIDENSRLR